MPYEDFKIVIDKIGDTDTYTVSVSQPCGGKGGDASGTFTTHDIPRLETAGAGVIEVDGLPGRLSILSERAPSRNTAETVGQQLSDALFRGQILQVWGQCSQYRPLRIRLDLSSAPQLAALPWELLRFPGQNTSFVGLNDQVTLVRYLRTTEPVGAIKVAPPLRILIMASSPADLRQLNLAAEIVKIKQALSGLQEANFQIVVMESATTDALRETLKKAQRDSQPFHVFHFIGHGAYDATNNEGTLLFEDKAGNSDVIDAQELVAILQPYRSDLRLLVLNACETARGSTSNVYSSVAAKVMQSAGIPASVAMQYEITNKAAILFAGTLYSNLASGEPLERSVDLGRMKVNELDGQLEEWATPILYLRSENGNLFDIERIRAPEPPKGLDFHYNTIKPALENCSLVIFLGLDVNLSNRPFFERWEPEVGLPSAAELCGYLGRDFNVPSATSLADLAQQLWNQDIGLTEKLASIFSGNVGPTRLYDILGRLTQKVTEQLSEVPDDPLHASLLFVTTTYDNALENAFVRAGLTEYHTVCYSRDREGRGLFTHQYYKGGNAKPEFSTPLEDKNMYKGSQDRSPVILKLPGEVRTDESIFAIKEDDFVEFANGSLISQLPADLLGQVNTSRHLYLGYDIRNWTLRLLLNQLCANHDKRDKSYAVSLMGDPMEMFWRKKGVQRTNTNLDDYIAGLEAFVLARFDEGAA